jgi:hypothetical protein
MDSERAGSKRCSAACNLPADTLGVGRDMIRVAGMCSTISPRVISGF